MKIKNYFYKMLSVLRCLWHFNQFIASINIKHGLDLPNGNKGVKITKHISLGSHVVLNAFDGGSIIIGEGTYIGNSCRINSTTEVRLGQSVMIADNVYIADVDHNYNNINLPIIEQGFVSRGGVFIDDGAWIGCNAVIMPGVHIGKNAVIGANSLVKMDVPNYAVVVGTPAKIISSYNHLTGKYEKA